jgi:serine/threonine-protein kinase
MGEVYKARDTKLDRDVAIKVLPAALAQDPERLARFEREAKVLAALNHPNIAQIYGLEQRALVMELVEGDTLKGPLPVETALNYAKQIADALEAAHEKGITHRDLKPANIMITPAGVVKVLDFGLATVTQPSAASEGDPANSPTLTMRATQAGMIMGTAAYMSPEQAAGKTADKRADIWSFGVVLWEMLTGHGLFDGETISHVLADVLRGPIDFDKLPKETPRTIRDLLWRCLDRNVKTRLRDIGEARIVLGNPGGTEGPRQAEDLRHNKLLWPSVAAVFLLAFAVLAFVRFREQPPLGPQPMMRFSADLGPDALTGPRITAAISPDGQRLAFVARGVSGREQLATRLLNQSVPTLLTGTDNATDPFFSPDGKWIGFFADGRMKKISVEGGAAVTLCNVENARGASWGEDGNIIATLGSATGIGLSRVPDAGGAPQTLTKPLVEKGEVSHRWPQILPGGQSVLFTSSTVNGFYDDGFIEVLSLKTGQWKVVQRGGYFGRYVPVSNRSGYLVYVHQATLFGVAFDPGRLEVRGTPVPLLEDVAGEQVMAAGQLDFSRNGMLVYLSGKGSGQNWPVVWLDSAGKTQSLYATPGNYYSPRFSPDGKRLALSLGTNDIQVYDLQRDNMTRLTFKTLNNSYPVWTPDGKHIVFRAQSGTSLSLQWIRSDGGGEAQQLLEGKTELRPYSFPPTAGASPSRRTTRNRALIFGRSRLI